MHRSHSGFFGIVNSEEGFQNLVRFLFGDVRADGYLEIDQLTLPPAVEAERSKGRRVRASYLFEVVVSIRGKPWQLHRRTANENSAIFRKYDDLFTRSEKDKKTWVPNPNASPMLFTVFLDKDQSQTGKTLAFSLDLCVRVPEYEVDGVLFFKNHFEGGYLFRDMIILEAFPPARRMKTGASSTSLRASVAPRPKPRRSFPTMRIHSLLKSALSSGTRLASRRACALKPASGTSGTLEKDA